ncbi:RidA family protein [Mycobacteroides chelonae]|uniref:RidA family protein n=1 Tax=Mycobacteroides chelonae TaxID=1774 RepID=UPI0009928036|nr:Rid family detoxifying hydrolase [Mycobacteroides chelonae]
MTRTQIETPSAPKPFGSYSQGIRVGDTIHVAGQIPLSVETGQIVGQTVYEQTAQVLRNVRAILQAGGADFDDIVMLRAYLSGPEGFPELNEALEETFAAPYPARTTLYGVLPQGILVEIDALAITSDSKKTR